jgi:HK97 family phage prohead protease
MNIYQNKKKEDENMPNWDFAGWATKNDLTCSDGRIIRRNAFKVNDKQKVPLVWNHQHNAVKDVLGHAVLENRDEGVYAYCYFNNTQSGQDAKEQVQHGDVTALSIWANNLQQTGPEVLHGVIREVSLVLAGANPGAFIESVVAHGEPMEDYENEGIFYCDGNLELSHGDNEDKNKKEDNSMDGDLRHADDDTKNKDDNTGSNTDTSKDSGETVKDVYETLSDKQKKAVAIIVGQAITDAKSGSKKDSDNKEDNEDMKHNVFDNDQSATTLTHADVQGILDDAKRLGSLREAVNQNIENGGVLAHAAVDTTGMTTATGSQTYGFNDPDMLFPDYKSLNNPPEWISREMGWVTSVMNGVHHTPFSRIKSQYANITEDEARARGYIKGKQKKTEVFTTLKRTTDPTTIYKLQKMDRDDIIDITDFDVIAWIKAEMRVMLDEEIARAILIGDGRQTDDESHIPTDHIRPIASDVPLFNTKVKVDVSNATTAQDKAKETINAVIRARKNYKGSGNPTFYTTEDVVTEMLLIEDGIGHKIYKTESELATALRVAKIVTVEPMEGQTIDSLPLIGVIVNLADYNVGADKGGSVSLFDDFDLNFNQYEYLIETRISGALTKPYSALTILEDSTNVAG